MIVALEKEINNLKVQAEELRNTRGTHNELIIEHKLETAVEIGVLKRQIAENLKEIGQHVESSLAQQREAMNDAIQMAEFKRIQEVEFRSTAEQQRIQDWDNMITEIKHTQDTEIRLNRDKINNIMDKLSDITSLSLRAIEKSEESYAKVQETFSEESKQAIINQRASVNDLDMLKIRLERLEADTSLCSSALQPSDLDRILEGRGLNRLGEELTDLTLKVNSGRSDMGDFKREICQHTQELSGSIRTTESEIATQLLEVKSLILSFESRLQTLEEHKNPRSAISNTQGYGEEIREHAQVVERAQ